MTTRTINIHTDRLCAECKDQGAADNGLCLTCTGDAIAGKKMYSLAGQAVQAAIKTRAKKGSRMATKLITTDQIEKVSEKVASTIREIMQENALDIFAAWEESDESDGDHKSPYAISVKLTLTEDNAGVSLAAAASWTKGKGKAESDAGTIIPAKDMLTGV